MRTLIICAALAAATAVPAVASAQGRCVNPRTNATTGALVGAAGGALIGSQLAGRHSRGEGAVLGALGGAVLGGAVGNSQVRCPDGYYRYENGHYYDNSGSEYRYDNGPPPPPPQGAYGPPPPSSNYGPPPPPPGGYQNGGYREGYYSPGATNGFWQGAPERLSDRISFTEQQVRTAAGRHWINRGEARRAYGDIANVRRYESDARNRNGGHLRPEDRDYITNQLNYISQRVHWEARN